MLVKMNTLSRKEYDEIFNTPRVHTADDEEPDCMRCDNVCASDEICNQCGPEGWWCHYRRTEREEKEYEEED